MTKLLVAAALVVSALWAQQGSVIYPIAQQNLDRTQHEMQNQENVTRTDMKPSDFLPQKDNTKTDVTAGVCGGVGVGVVGVSGCADKDGTVSVSVSAFGGQVTGYVNPITKDDGGCVGVGGTVGVGPVDVSGGAGVCDDRHEGLTGEASGDVGPVEVTATVSGTNR